MEIHIQIIGSILILLALVHIIFPKYFNWKLELINLSLINRQMMTTHTFFIALTVFLMGLLCISQSHSLTSTDLGKTICLGLGIFWLVRLFFQLFIYSAKLWKGKTFETIIHIFFTLFWTYMSVVFMSVYYA
ncbi:hypothetical protein [Leeuwenhoekiella nanhaiensis]|uniref:Uncharacterized protein n=1 Tax=Leeuwenhoekiella nanhaiensis TaxID=1655491 RepID=A0A2G1VS56_9FLAO|nr:hypothetical protein [Leeuwenhoekiella nanhaiensis]PHQ29440.1 hypothetical protein CJ305_08965 [Leeuwenhoekiella nanhaiensis]